MSVICFTLALLVCAPAPAALAPTQPLASVRGGHAKPLPARGGAAQPVLEPVGPLDAWTCIHSHEAAWNDSGDPYWGGLQMDWDFMRSYGADMLRKYGGPADRWTPRDQMVVAERARASGRGFGPWPNTRIPCGV